MSGKLEKNDKNFWERIASVVGSGGDECRDSLWVYSRSGVSGELFWVGVVGGAGRSGFRFYVFEAEIFDGGSVLNCGNGTGVFSSDGGT